ncbi:kinase [Hirsutella rhossiliensis]|uniref:mitogen-activated protein kinase n=1 Tax=Hirsutella rhossiliensis TaxID=111463 RepID=A0A9P8MZS0_9HYPO|nr:kinase [Hirsutella rhossiliensis]KAH0964245.1 kinase [Hirsutella rhossiliensis]
MVRPAHPETIFHLKPEDDSTAAILRHQRNAPFVSRAANGDVALEIGYHESSRPRGGRVIARLGRDADLVLPARHISQVHVAFEAHPISSAILFCVRAQDVKTVGVGPRGLSSDGDFRQVVLVPEGEYDVAICTGNGRPFRFRILWKLDTLSTSRTVHAAFQAAEARALNPYWLKTECDDDSDVKSWYHTRLLSKAASDVQEVLCEQNVDSGAFGTVSRAIDLDSGQCVAVKTVCPANDRELVNLHREIKTLGTLKHPHIIELLGYSSWDSVTPSEKRVPIFMPLRAGSLCNMLPLPAEQEKPIVLEITYQMLLALDYLSSRHLYHRDVKSANVLYYIRDGSFYPRNRITTT